MINNDIQTTYYLDKKCTQTTVTYSYYLDTVIDLLRIKGYEPSPCRMKIEYNYIHSKTIDECVKSFV